LILLFIGAATWFQMLFPIVITHGIAVLLQYVVRRERPPVVESRIVMWHRTPSFPSAHSATSMAFVVAIAASVTSFGDFAPVFVFTLLLLAIAIGLSRIIVGVHYVTDVICGWIFGIVVGGIILALM
jgi:undecaprenyl-diphosphatase